MKRIFGFFGKENSVRGASLILMITLTLSNILGLFRDRFLTKNISTFDLDIYYAAFRIPDLVFNFLILGAITAAFIPVFSEFITKKDEKGGYRVTNSLINLAALAMIVMAVILYFLMPLLMPLVVPKFSLERMSQSIF
jgi:putative peptidoglycan lipid II flippase